MELTFFHKHIKKKKKEEKKKKKKPSLPSKEIMFALFSVTPAKICTSKRNRKHLLKYL